LHSRLHFLIFCGRRQDPTLATKVMVIKNQAFGSKTTDSVKPTASPLKQHGTKDASKLNFSSKSNKTQKEARSLSAQ
ncbi:MAG: hypothetical protein PWK00_06525, partial [Coxiella burnetii]|nr:hypothetical protein [Coxiella burnetii]